MDIGIADVLYWITSHKWLIAALVPVAIALVVVRILSPK
jgi:hypothetical protein